MPHAGKHTHLVLEELLPIVRLLKIQFHICRGASVSGWSVKPRTVAGCWRQAHHTFDRFTSSQVVVVLVLEKARSKATHQGLTETIVDVERRHTAVRHGGRVEKHTRVAGLAQLGTPELKLPASHSWQHAVDFLPTTVNSTMRGRRFRPCASNHATTPATIDVVRCAGQGDWRNIRFDINVAFVTVLVHTSGLLSCHEYLIAPDRNAPQ